MKINIPDAMTRQSMLLRLRADSPAREIAWEEFHTRYAPIIAGFARRLGAPAGDVDDLVQDVLLAFYGVSATFQYDPTKGKFRAFLKTITFRQLCNKRGRESKFKGKALDDIDPQSDAIQDAWEEVWDDEQLRRAIAQLRKQYSVNADRQRTFRAFELYVLKERPQDEVARGLGISVDSVHQAKHRLTGALRRQLRKITDLEG